MLNCLFKENLFSDNSKVKCLEALNIINDMKEEPTKSKLKNFLNTVIKEECEFSESRFRILVKTYRNTFKEGSIGYNKLTHLLK